MGPTLSLIAIIAIWIISFVEPSGYATLIHLPEKIDIVLVALSAFLFFTYPNKRQHISQYVVIGILISFVLLPFLLKGSNEGLSYLTSFLCVYIVSNGTYTKAVIQRSGLIIALLGLAVLYIYANGEILSGWNENAISMVGLFSFLYFSISLIYVKGTRMFWVYNIISIIYINLLFASDCRSGVVFLCIAIACILFTNKAKQILAKNDRRLLIILNVPLLLAFIVIAISHSSYFQELDAWSERTSQKGIFDGRDILWQKAFEMLEQSNYLGWGKFTINYHNSGIAALTVFGVIGYVSWIAYFYGILKKIARCLGDRLVFGCFLAFVLIFLQQSVELGLISPNPNLLPYMILGIALARIRTLKTTAA